MTDLPPPSQRDSSTTREQRRSPFRLGPFGWLLVAVALFFVVSFVFSWVRALEFQTTTWDEGLYQQALWSSAHGRPFYETADVETGGYGSLLQVHSVFLLYLLVPLYAVLPYQTTLFAVQSAAVALAAVPLYFLAKDLSKSPRLGLLAGALFLAWTPVLSSTLYDFHPEAFLPLELFTLALLWERRRFRAGLMVAALAFLTLEIAPVLTFFFALFALGTQAPVSAPVPTSESDDSRLHRLIAAARNRLRNPTVRASLVLLVASAFAYGLLLYVRLDYLTGALGTYPLAQSPTGYVIGSTPAALGLAFGNVSVGFVTKVTYWLIALALLAFVPLLAPRALIVSIPWFAFTMLSTNLNYVTLGFQYGFVAASSLLIALAYGLPVARDLVRSISPLSSREAIARRAPARSFRRIPRRQVVVTTGIVCLFAINLALSPLNPAMQNDGLGSAYRLSYSPNAGDQDVVGLVTLIPPGSTVLASDDLFPLVADNENSYSFLWTADTALALPFNDSRLPSYVLLAEDRTDAVPVWLSSVLYDQSLFGVRGVAWSSDVGTVLLFEAGWSGAPAQFGSPASPGGSYFGLEVVSPEAGFPTTAPGSTYSTVVKSAPGAAGTVWYGPGTSLVPGNYTVTVSLQVVPLAGFPTPDPSAPVLWVGALAFGLPSLCGVEYSYGSLESPGWETVTFNVSLPGPVVEFDVQGVLVESSVQVTLNYLQIAPS